MNLTKLQVQHISNLAQLGLSDAEVEKFQKQLSSILEYMKLLNKVETADVEPTAQTTGLKNVTRKDKLQKDQCLTQGEALANAPEKKNGYVKTKAVL